MVYTFTEKEKWEIVGYIKISQMRYKTLKTINDDYLMPKEIAEITGLTSAQISKCLASLKEKNLIYCVNENLRKGRIYQTTALGVEVLDMLEGLGIQEDDS